MNTTESMTRLLTCLTLTLPLSAHSLFDPVPTDSMRDLAADRPDATESPITVDAGHVQFEASLVDWSRDGGDETWTVMASNLKFGLTDCTDLQIVWDSYIAEDPGLEGFGDVTLRFKWNLWGNDGGNTGLALFPFVKIPTGTALSNDVWEGGLIVPFSMGLTERTGLGLMAELDYVDDENGGYDFEFVHTAVLGFDLSERWGCFVEYIGVLAEDHYEASASGGFTYAVHANLVLDAGARVGLNGHAEDVGLFSGFTVRY